MPAQPSIALVLFDIDGTLLDHDAAAQAAVEQWLIGTGWAVPAEISRLAVAWHEISERHFPAYQARTTTFQEQRRARLRDFLPLLGIDASRWHEERLDATFESYLAAYEAAWRCFPDVAPCLEALRSVVAVAALSNGDQAQQEDKIARAGLRPYLDAVLTSDLLGPAKPDPEIFASACRRLGVAPEKSVYVGDRLDVDAVAASRAALRGIWLDRSGGAAPPGVDRITSLAELPLLLQLKS